jgi:hypothetical protein
VRITARGRKTVVKIDTDNEEYVQPEVWFAACEEWLNLVGGQGWSLVAAQDLGETHVRYVLVKGEEASAKKAPAKEKTITEQLTEQVAGKAVKSVLKI